MPGSYKVPRKFFPTLKEDSCRQNIKTNSFKLIQKYTKFQTQKVKKLHFQGIYGWQTPKLGAP